METAPGYQAALESAAFLIRGGIRFLEVTGKAPGDMLKGILSGTIPAPMAPWGKEDFQGLARYSTVLTPKGKMVTDLRVVPRFDNGFLLLVPEAGFSSLEAHFKKYLHPRFAQTRDRSGERVLVSVVGPRGAGALGEVIGGDALQDFGSSSVELERARSVSHPAMGPLLLLENPEAGVPALDVVLEPGAVEPLLAALEEAGAVPMTPEDWEVLRIEAGTPAFGTDMTEDTIPVEAGIHDRAIDHRKGCYTGQEVIVRIRDRGQVNKTLRKILLADAPVPEAGTELFPAAGDRSKGWVTSACVSPRYGQTVALAYVKRGLELRDEVRLGGSQGAIGRVEPLTPER